MIPTKKPKMILFDYGHTLLYEPDFAFLRGETKLLDYIKVNKQNNSPEQITSFADTVFAEMTSVRKQGFDLHERQFQRFVYEYLGIEFHVSHEEAEIIQWDAVSAGECMPGIEKMIMHINKAGIRSGVISNIGWSGSALTERINRLLPKNQFEFILASSEYMFRKPHRYIFELALHKAELSPDEVWFCGDTVEADVEGSANVGMFPIWYDDLTVAYSVGDKNNMAIPKCEHLHIHHWDDLIEVLEALK